MAKKTKRKRRPTCVCSRKPGAGLCWVCWNDPTKRLGKFYPKRGRRRSPRPPARPAVLTSVSPPTTIPAETDHITKQNFSTRNLAQSRGDFSGPREEP